MDTFFSTLPAALSLTINLTLLAWVGGMLFAACLVVLAQTGMPIVGRTIGGFIAVWRGTPFLLQLFFLYYGLGQITAWTELIPSDTGTQTVAAPLSPWVVACLALVLNSGAHQACILREALSHAAKHHGPSAQALGLPTRVRVTHIFLPTALPTAWPLLGNELLFALKATSVVSFITLQDLTGSAQIAFATSFDVTVFLAVIAVYLAVAAVLEMAIAVVDHRIAPSRLSTPASARRSEPDTASRDTIQREPQAGPIWSS